MTISLAHLNEILQKDYIPGFVAQINEKSSFFYKTMEKKDLRALGGSTVFLVTYGRSGGMGMFDEGDDLPTPSAAGRKQISIVPKNFGARFALTDRLIKSSATDAAFIEALDLEMREVSRDSTDNLNVQMFGDGSGIRAQVTTGATAKAFVVDDTKYLFVNQKVDVIDESALPTVTKLVDGATITNIDRATKTITLGLANNVALAEDDMFVIAGSYNKEITGLNAIMTPNNTIYGLDRSTNKWYNPNLITMGVNEKLEDDIMEQAFQSVDYEAGKDPDLVIAGYFAYRTLLNYLSEYQRFVEIETKYQAGHKTMSYNGVPIEKDKYQKDDTMDFLNMESFNLMSIGKLFDWMDSDGAVLSRVSGKAAYEATLLSYAEIKNDHPASNCRITSITG